MDTTPDRSDELRRLLADSLASPNFRRCTFAGKQRGPNNSPWTRIVVRPTLIRGERHLQFSRFDDRKNHVDNHRGEAWRKPLEELLTVGYSAIHVTMVGEEIDLRISKKGKLFVGRKRVSPDLAPPIEEHNATKDLPLPEGRADHVLEAIGVMSADGKVKPTMRAKFTQINEFLKLLEHAIDEAELRHLGREIDILDCGCGAGYLTVAVQHYLNDILTLPAKVLGVDLNEALLRSVRERADGLGIEAPTFAAARIGAEKRRADIVLALHACDTATDDAIAQAIRSEAKLVMSVPCCHHHLNAQLKAVGEAEVFRPILRHGLMLQRTADLVTDAFRCLALRICGYHAEAIEFISPEHTARNLMIRATRTRVMDDPKAIEEYQRLKQFWGVIPYIEEILGDDFRKRLEVTA